MVDRGAPAENNLVTSFYGKPTICRLMSAKQHMKIISISILCSLICSCGQPGHGQPAAPQQYQTPAISKPYTEVKDNIEQQRERLHTKLPTRSALTDKENLAEITDIWVHSIATDLYTQWQGTPWDFNGTIAQPNTGSIACGYFVTTILRDMGVKIDRVKLAICASSVMMKTLVPDQKLKNLSGLSYDAFNTELTKLGKGVYIIGLDFHTGFIVNDGANNWFIHSNYIGRKGVTKEVVLQSAALKASKTRWLVSLTGDRDFLYRWLCGK